MIQSEDKKKFQKVILRLFQIESQTNHSWKI